MKKNCIVCNIEFETKIHNKTYCSIECSKKNKIIKCSYCGNTFRGNKSNHYCSKECKQLDLPNVVKRREAACLKRYGVKNPSQSEEIKRKKEETSLKKYGTKYALQNPEYREKREKENLEKYGYKNFFQIKEIQDKQKETIKKKYGVDNVSQLEEVKNKKKATFEKKWGVSNPLSHPGLREKGKKTCLKKYGTEYATQSDIIKKKTINTNIDRYGYEYHMQKHIQNYENYNEGFVRSNFIKDGYYLVDDVIDYFKITRKIAYDIKYKFNITEPNKSDAIRVQSEIYEWITSIYNGEVINNNAELIKPKQLDIYIPDKKFSLEYDGLWFHSFGVSKYSMFNNYEKEDKYKHLRKTEMCEEKGIKLFHIFENEWMDSIKQDIWKSKIMYELGIIENKIDARKCEIKELNTKDIKLFLEENHLQGYSQALINLGLFYNNELVEVMTFSKSRFNKSYEWELIRSCTKTFTIVRGGFNKLLNYFKSNYEGSIVSYGNRRWTSKLCNVYGNNLINETEPNYFYFYKSTWFKLYSRQQFQKHKLKDKLEKFDPNLTEAENMFNNGYRRIWDCGNLVYEL